MKSLAPLPLRLLTHNIRYATSSPFMSEQDWKVRRSRIISELRFNTAHCSESFICLQEALHHQLIDIMSGLNKPGETWAFIGVGRDDGRDAGEYSPIIYRSNVWVLKDYKNVWLSETPDRPSKSWDAASVRILTIGVFQHHDCKKTIVAMNTHLDDQGAYSRWQAAKIILQQVALFSENEKGQETLPVFLAGDFNSEPDGKAYMLITGDGSPMCDIQSRVPEDQRYGNLNTFTGFENDQGLLSRIDFLFVNLTDMDNYGEHGAPRRTHVNRWLVEHYGVLENRFEDGVFTSDHRAVIGDVLLQ